MLVISVDHAVVAFGFNNTDNDLYMHDPGNGTVIRDYSDFTTGANNVTWDGTLYMTASATTCPLDQHIIGTLNNTQSTYKALQDIFASCSITSGSDIVFECGDDIELESGFEISVGCTFEMNAGATVACP